MIRFTNKRYFNTPMFFLNIAITIFSFYLIRDYFITDFLNLAYLWNIKNIFFLLFAIFFIIIQNIVLIFRFKFFLEISKIYSKLSLIRPIIFKSSLLNQILPTGIGGDILKFFFYKSKNKNNIFALKNVFNERIVGFLSMFFICLFLIPFIYYQSYLIIADIILIILSLRIIFTHYKNFLLIFCLSFLSHFFLILSFFSIASIVSFNFSIFLYIPFIIFGSMIPLSFAGWGIREIFSISILTYYGFTTNDSLLVSLLFGFSLLVACIIMYLFEIIIQTYLHKRNI